MKRKFTFLIAAAFMLLTMMASTGTMWGQTRNNETATLTQSNLELTGSYTTGTEKTIGGITYVYTDLMKNNDNIQAKASTGTIKNKTAYPGDIVSVAITHSGTARSTTISGSANGTDWTAIKTGEGSITGDFTKGSYKYFKITRGSNAAYWTQIVITYSTGSSTYTVTYDDNGATSGAVPTDNNTYESGDAATVLGNTGSLAKTGNTWSGWTREIGGTPKTYSPGDSLIVKANTTLLAKWTTNTHTVTMPAADTYGSYAMDQENPVAFGTNVTLTYTPASGYESYSATWSVNGTPIVGNTFVMPDEDVTVTVACNEIIDFTIFTGALEEGDYVIYYEGVALTNTTSSNRLGYTSVTPANNKISNPAPSIVWHLTQSGDYWTIYNAAVNKYAASTGTKNQATLLADGTDDKSLWTVSGNSTYDFVNKKNNASNINKTLRYNDGYGFACYSIETGGALTLYKKPQALTPTFSPAGGAYYEAQNVVISCNTDGATIHYTTDGSIPTSASPTYSAAINVSTTTTIKAIAIKSGMLNSDVATATYTIMHNVEEPVMEDATFTANGYEVIILVPDNTTVYYTTDGSLPTNESTEYDENNPFTIDKTTTVKAIAYDNDGCYSEVVTATYTRTYTLAEAKALYTDQDVPNVVIRLAGVQFIAKSGNYTYVQQGTVGLLIFGSHSQDLTNGDVFTAGTITGTISKYGENKQIKSFTFANVTKEAGTLTASETDVAITDVTGSFSTYEDRYVALTSLTMNVSGKTLTDANSNTLPIYDPFGTLTDAIQPNDNVVVTGVVTSNYKNSTTTYQIIPLAKSDISTGITATLPTLNPAGGVDAEHATECENVTITPAENTSVEYVFGEDTDVITAPKVITVPSTMPTELVIESSRDFYNTNIASYYYKTSLTMYQVKFFVNGTENVEWRKEVVENGAIGNLPIATAANGYSFIGWATTEIDGTQPNAPAMINSETTVTGAMNLYAVFAIAEENVDEVTKSYGWEDNDDASVWTISEAIVKTNGEGNTGSYAGKINTNHTYVTFNNKVKIKEFSFAFKRTSTNSNYNVYIETSTDNSEWASAETYTMGSFSNGSYTTKTKTFDGTTEYYVRFHCYNTTATRYVDDVTIKYGFATVTYNDYCTSVSPAPIPVDGNGEMTGNTTIPSGAAYTITTPVTVPEGITLTVNGTLGNDNPANLIIEDGGQVIVNNTSVQAIFKKSVSHSASKDAANWYTISSPVNNIAPGSVTNLIQATPANYDLYYYDEATTTWFNHKADGHAVANMTNGKGYLYWNNTGAELSFPGELNSGTVEIAVTKTGTGDLAGFNLIGNPYSHNIYKGDGTAIPNSILSAGYYTLSNAGAWTAGTDNTTAIKPGQGILVKATAAGTVTMTNTTANGAKRNNEFIKFMIANSQYEDVAYALFNDEEGLNKINHRNANIPMLYIPQDGQNYAIATMSDETQSFNLNFKAMTTGQYTLSYKAEGNYDYLHVIDRLTGEDIDMLLDGEYSFIASPSDNDARFIVKLGYNTNNSAENDIFAFQNGSDIVVNGEGELQVFDVTGRMVATQHVNGVQTVNVPSQGVFIFKLNEKTQKIVVR